MDLELLHVVSAKGLPIPFFRWLSNFLSNRPARVQPKFLRVTLGRMLTFGPHIQNILTKAAARCRLLAITPAWEPWAALPISSSWSVAKIMIGQLKSTPVETVQREADIETASKRATALTYEKAQRLPPDQPRRKILAASSRHRLKRSSWRTAAQAATSGTGPRGSYLLPLLLSLGIFKQLECTY